MSLFRLKLSRLTPLSYNFCLRLCYIFTSVLEVESFITYILNFKSMNKCYALILTLMLGFCSVIVSSCSDEETPIIPEITFPEGTEDFFVDDIIFSSSANHKKISFKTNVDWNISVSQSRNGKEWCSVSPLSGHGGLNTVVVSVSENNEYDDRSIVLKLQVGTIERYINIVQKQKNALTLSSSKFELKPEGGVIDIEVKSNIDYEVVIPSECQDWIKPQANVRGLVSKNLRFNVAKSEEYSKREGAIIIQAGELSETIRVYQTGKAILLLSKNEYKAMQKGGEFKVDVKSNFDFDVQMPDVAWIKEVQLGRACSSHSLYFVVSANDTYDERRATITFYDKNSSLSEKLVVTQSQTNAIIISAKNYEILPNGGKLAIEVNSNVSYDMKLPNESWIHKAVKTRGLNTSREVIVIDANNTATERTAQILFENKELALQESVYIRQKSQNLNDFRVKLDYAGTLDKQIPAEIKNKITKLTIEGPLNGTDIRFLREMSGRDVNNGETSGSLKVLNMRYATIVKGGDPYFLEYWEGEILSSTTSDNKFGDSFFNGCKLTEIVIPVSVDAVYGSAFQDCKELHKVELNNVITTLHSSTFNGCTSLRSLEIPTSVTEIRDAVFANCGLEEITIPSNVKKIGGALFHSCTSLKEVNLPYGITEIPISCFWGCTNLLRFNIPSSVTRINSLAFGNCTSIQSVSLSSGLQYIGQQVFSGCTSLSNVSLPSTLQTIGGFVFSKCINLSYITCHASYPPQLLSLISDNSSVLTVYVPRGSLYNYKNAKYWSYCKIVEMI